MDKVEEKCGGDDNVLDMTSDPDRDEDTSEPIRLVQGIDMKSFRKTGVACFEQEIPDDEDLLETNPNSGSSFQNLHSAEEFDAAFAQLGLGEDDNDQSDDDENSDLSDFEKKAKKMNNIIEDGGVKKRTVIPGLEMEGKPPVGATVTIHYSLFLEGLDEPYDSSVLRGRAERFKLDDGRMLPGMEFAIKSMCPKEKSHFLISPYYAFGQVGCPPRVPPDSTILAHVELIKFVSESEAEAILAIPSEERNKKKSFEDFIEIVRKEQVEAIKLFKDQEYRSAATRYERGIRILEELELRNEKDQKVQEDCLKKFRISVAQCYLKIGWPKKACVQLQKVFKLDLFNAKANYHMAKAKRQLGNLKEAKNFLLRAQKRVPNDNDVAKELKSVIIQINNERNDELEICRKMFTASSSSADKKEDIGDVKDEVYEEIYEQLKAFLEEPTTDDVFTLPTTFTEDELGIARSISAELGLTMKKQSDFKGDEWVVVKGKN